MRVLGHLIIAAVLLCQAAVSQAQTLRIAVAAFPPTLGNPFTGASQPSAELWWSIYDGLTRLNWSGGAGASAGSVLGEYIPDHLGVSPQVRCHLSYR